MRHINPRYFNVGTAPANAIAVYVRERDVEVIECFRAIGKAEVLVVPNDEADAVQKEWEKMQDPQNVVDHAAASAVEAQLSKEAGINPGVSAVSLTGSESSAAGAPSALTPDAQQTQQSAIGAAASAGTAAGAAASTQQTGQETAAHASHQGPQRANQPRSK